MHTIDFRSDTVTKPSKTMLKAMIEAEVGDDVYGEDPTVSKLEVMAADLLGKEAALFVPSGTQSNLVALLSHCQRGDEYLVGQQAHTYRYEGGGAAVLGSIQPQPVTFEPDGTLDLDKLSTYIKPDDFHFARTKLLCLENTHNGIALPNEYFAKAAEFAKVHGLALHLDGARLFNAVVHTKTSSKNIAQPFDSISICLSKGLGTPVGSVLCGNKEFVQNARRWRKMVGGGMRQAGILAAAGIYALQNNIERLADDHSNARLLADKLSLLDGVSVEFSKNQTNMVFISLNENIVGDKQLVNHLKQNSIIIPEGKRKRLVTHLDISEEDILMTIEHIKQGLTLSI